MSIKTMKKRIAVVAASALTVGFLTVVSAPVANAAVFAAGDLNTTTTTASPGICNVDQAAGEQAITLVTGRTFQLTVDTTASNEAVYIGAAGSIKIDTASGFDTVTETYAFDHDKGYVAEAMTLTVSAGAVGSGTLTVRPTSSTTSAVEVISFSVVAACAGNTYSPTYSYAQLRTDTDAATSNVDEVAAATVVNGGVAYLALLLEDEYSTTLSGTGALVATVSSGIAAWETDPTIQSSTAYSTSLSDNTLHIKQGDANKDKPLTVTVNVTLNGTSVASKTFKFQGVATTIEIKGVSVGKVASVGVYRARVLDAAGNALATKTVEGDSTANSVASVSSIASISASAVSAADGDWSSETQGQFTCVKSGTTTINVKHVISTVTGATVKKSFAIACGEGLDTWTVSMDKASYQPGEIATLTVSGKDSKGFPVNSSDLMGTAGTAITSSFGGMSYVTAPSGGDKFTSAAGAKTYTLQVGTTEGSFVGTFVIAGATDTAAKTVQYKVASATPGVSNADVLKSIVALIASINKQIQALQKLILKR
jgi:hypothetical protein